MFQRMGGYFASLRDIDSTMLDRFFALQFVHFQDGISMITPRSWILHAETFALHMTKVFPLIMTWRILLTR
ncbi:hypothetical protein C6V08_19010 [Burkholderia gladioli]|nr:hypothetical protein C6V08_19010 [Burkholderia gladioli]